MLLQACRDGDLDVVLRLLYTNPFIEKQELHDGVWEAVRCKQVEVLRSLLEFRVDPACAPSATLSQPPAQLRHVPWTPLLGLAVSGSMERARLVAELLSGPGRRSGGESGDPSRGHSHARGPATGHEERQCQRSPASSSGSTSSRRGAATHKVIPTLPYPSSALVPVEKLQPSEAGSPKARCGSGQSPFDGFQQKSDARSRQRAPEDGAPMGQHWRSNKGAMVASEPDLETTRRRGLLADVLARSDTPNLDGSLQHLKLEDLGTLESELDSLLRIVRSHHQKRWETQLQSLQRKSAEESRGRLSIEEEQVCVVCSEMEKTVLFLPCRHMCTCQHCSEQLNQCPICRADIDDRVRAYKS